MLQVVLYYIVYYFYNESDIWFMQIKMKNEEKKTIVSLSIQYFLIDRLVFKRYFSTVVILCGGQFLLAEKSRVPGGEQLTFGRKTDILMQQRL